jgi:spermidine synthase/MFS family permease
VSEHNDPGPRRPSARPHPAERPSALNPANRGLAYLAFFASGASSLIFQSLWTRTLHHVFGSSSVAMATVLTAFMAGLGLGAYLFGRIADRIPHPILTYGLAELLVGAWALLLPSLVSTEGWLADVNAFLRTSMGADSIGFMLARFACVAPILLVPTTLMGASLPLLSRHFVRRGATRRDVSAVVGSLYSVNTFGAVLGVGLGGFVLMPELGLRATTFVAVGMNVGLGLTIFAFRRVLLGDTWRPGEPLRPLPVAGSTQDEDQADAPPEAAEEEDDGFALPMPKGARTAALVTFGASGFAAFAYELVWTRALAMTIGSSVYSFTIILLTFLIGIALGSAVASGAIARGRGGLGALAASAVGLLFLGNSVAALDDGLVAYLLLTLVFALPIALLVGAYLVRAHHLGVDPKPPALAVAFLLAVPVVVAVVWAKIVPERVETLATIVAAVVLTLAVFVALIVSLRRYPLLQLALVQLFIAGASVVTYVFQDDIPCAFASMVSAIQHPGGAGRTVSLEGRIGLVQFFMFLTAGLSTLPATMGMGAMFPLALRVWTAGGAKVGEDVGRVYSANTIGSIFGAWLTGFALMPWLGIELTLVRVGIYLNLGLALLLLIVSAGDPATKPDEAKASASERGAAAPPTWHTVLIYVLAPLIPACVAFLYIATQSPTSFLRWDLDRMTLGVFRVSMSENACNLPRDVEIVFHRDGLSTTVTVEKFRFGPHIALKNNGKVDASNGDDMPTQVMVAGYPLLMHGRGPEGLDVAIVGFGSGVTVGAALRFPVRSVDVIELERSIPEAARWFREVNHLNYALDEFPFVQMDRLQVINDDGRNYLASTDRRYDVIISEPSNPWITGVSDLFTTDHFRITKQRLREGGIYCQWVQLYELSPENIKSIYRTFASQYRYVKVFSADDLSSDTILLGSDSPLPLDLGRLREAYAAPGIAAELERANIHAPQDVFARVLLADRDEVMRYTQIERRRSPTTGAWEEHPDSSNDPERGCAERGASAGCELVPVVLNTDDNMHIEFEAPRDLIGYQRYEGYLAELYSPEWPYGRIPGRVLGLGEGAEGAEARAELALSLAGHGRRVEAAHFLRESQETGESPLTIVALETLTRLVAGDGEPIVPIETPIPGPQLNRREARSLLEGFDAVRHAVDDRDYESALASLQDIPAPVRRDAGPSLALLHGYLLYKTGASHPTRYDDAWQTLEELVHEQPAYVARHPEVYYFLGRAYDLDLRFDQGVRYMRHYVELEHRAMADAAEEANAPAEAGEAPSAEPPTSPSSATPASPPPPEG